MTDTIMVAVDGRPEHRAALRWATERAVREGARLELVYVIDRSWGDASDGPEALLVTAAETLLASAQESALRFAARAPARAPALSGPQTETAERSPLAVSTRHLYGHVGAELTRASRDADLLVVGTRSGTDREHGFAGTLHVRVAATAACSVAAVPHGWEPSGVGVVVGVDGQPQSDIAAAFAAAEAAALDEPLRIVCVGYSANPLLAGLVPEVSLGDHRQRIVDAAADAARASHPAIDVRAEVVEASPSRGLVAAAEGHRMLVVGTHNRRSAKRIMLGSVSHDVLLNVRVPVVVAREHRELE
ncbi:universal stress protein [Leifsonia shinshuensis]|uniref:universal stress protein n=1 Tax=Leifsonia shinshuensis TaxID=150026 RepID=UPI001F5137F3|nr:universal stress protein [Leifsonia shinshuensis]MCI0158992.1 universal stress protein [Leifsonia shinshuensis]